VFTAYSITSSIHGQHLNLAFCYMLNFSVLMPGHLGQSMINQAGSMTVNIGKKSKLLVSWIVIYYYIQTPMKTP
jgi:hypothetical protein